MSTHLDLPTPALLLDAAVVRRNIQAMADYARAHRLKLHPHTKTHKSRLVAQLQLLAGADGLTVAKPGEAEVMADVGGDLLLAYPVIDPAKCRRLAELARRITLRVGVDSAEAVDALADAARAAGSTIGLLADLDVGMHRTGVASPRAALELAQHIDRAPHVRLDGLMFYPGHVTGDAESMSAALRGIDAIVTETLDGFDRAGLDAKIVSGSSTPTALLSHLVKRQTHMRCGTYVYHDRNGILGGYAGLDDCAARYLCTVVSTAVPGQVIIDAGTKTLTSDRSPFDPAGGFGLVVEYPAARITKLTEEHGQVDVSACARQPKIGERVTVVPNHVCPSINLHDHAWWLEPGEEPRRVPIDARGRVQ